MLGEYGKAGSRFDMVREVEVNMTKAHCVEFSELMKILEEEEKEKGRRWEEEEGRRSRRRRRCR